MPRNSRKRSKTATRKSADKAAPIQNPGDVSKSEASAADLLFESANLEQAESLSKSTAVGPDPVIEAIAANTALIQQLLDQVSSKDNADPSPAAGPQKESSDDQSEQVDQQFAEQLQDQIAELHHRNSEHLLELERRQTRIEELTRQTEDLADQIAQSGVRQTVATNQSSSSDALSWEDRKKLILQQLESDTF